MSAPSRPGPSNFAGTLVLACVALGLTAVTYLAKHRGASPDLPYTSSAGSPLNGGNNLNNPSRYNNRRGTAVPSSAASHPSGPQKDDGKGKEGQTRQLYYSLCAERHTRRLNTNMMEWWDEQLGLSIGFSPAQFEVRSEERQAPLILLTMDCLKQKENQVTITMEETFLPETPEGYRESSMLRIADCSKILSLTSTRIGNTQHPQAEYCYVDETDRLTFVLAVFLTHDRLAITVQYVAGSRVRGNLPTAFSEIIRSIRFTAPRPSPSYVLVSEPRLGLGYRVPLDFMATDLLLDEVGSSGGGGNGYYPTNPNTLSSSFITLAGRGSRHMGVIASYEPSMDKVLGLDPRQLSSGLSTTSTRGGGMTKHHWQHYLEHQVLAAVRRLGVRPCVPLQLRFIEDMNGGNEPAGTVLIRPYSVNVSTKGNFNDSEEDGDLKLEGSFCLIYENLDPNSPCLTFMRSEDDTRGSLGAYICIFVFPIREECVSFCFVASPLRHSVEEFFSFCTATIQSLSLGNHNGQSTSLIYCSQRHPIASFAVSLNATDIITVEEPILGDPIAVFHCHGLERVAVLLRVFPLLLPPRGDLQSGTTTPAGRPGKGSRRHSRMLDLLLRQHLSQLPGGAIIHVWEPFTVHGMTALKVCYEFPSANPLSSANPDGTAATAAAGSTLPPGVGVHVDDLDAVSVATSEWIASRSLALEEEVGSLNPFARYYPPPYPPDCYFGLQPPPEFPLDYNEVDDRSNAKDGRPSRDSKNTKQKENNAGNGISANTNQRNNNSSNTNNNNNNNNNNSASLNANPLTVSHSLRGEGTLVPSSSIVIHKNGSVLMGSLPNGSILRSTSPRHTSEPPSPTYAAPPAYTNGGEATDGNDEDTTTKVAVLQPQRAPSLLSTRSQEEYEDPLRVSVAVIRDRQVFLFTAGASVYSYASIQQVVTELAGNVLSVPESG